MTTDNVVPMLGKHQPLDANLQALRDHPSTAHKAFGNEWAANCAGSALAEITRLQAQLAAQQALVGTLVGVVKEMVNLCAVGDVDESTEAYGWGGVIRDANAALAKVG